MESLAVTIKLPVANTMNFDALSSRSSIFSNQHTPPISANFTTNLLSGNFLQKLSEQFNGASFTLTSPNTMDVLRNQIVLNSSTFDSEEFKNQMEYDKFMNEIWIGIVLTLIVISMVFCICSCFLYHQFRIWKRNYRNNLQQSQDIESAKLNPDEDDPVPEYTLVSGLPSYEAALELLQKTPKSCLIVYPSIFEVFSANEKANMTLCEKQQGHALPSSRSSAALQQSEIPVHSATIVGKYDTIPSYDEATGTSARQSQHHFKVSIDEKVPPYEDVLLHA